MKYILAGVLGVLSVGVALVVAALLTRRRDGDRGPPRQESIPDEVLTT